MNKFKRAVLRLSIVALVLVGISNFAHRPPKPEIFRHQVIDHATICSVIIKEYMGSYVKIGTGVIVQDDGTVITAAHMVTDEGPLVMYTRNHRRYKVVALAVDRDRDLAIVYPIDGDRKFPYVCFPSNPSTPAGTRNFIIGHPLRAWYNVSTGRVRNQTFEYINNSRWDLVTTPVDHGNSGGGMFNAQGELVGIVSAGYFSVFRPTIGVIAPATEILAFAKENNARIQKAKMMIKILVAAMGE